MAGIFVPESPRFLYARGRTAEALNVVNTLRALNCQQLINNPLISYEEASNSGDDPHYPDGAKLQQQEGGIREDIEEENAEYEQMDGNNANSVRKLRVQQQKAAQQQFQQHQTVQPGFLDQFFTLFSDKYATSTLLLWVMWWLLSYGTGGFYFIIFF